MAEKKNASEGLKTPSKRKPKKKYEAGIVEKYIAEREQYFKDNRMHEYGEAK